MTIPGIDTDTNHQSNTIQISTLLQITNRTPYKKHYIIHHHLQMFTVDDYVGVFLFIWFFMAFMAIIAKKFDQFIILFIPTF